MSLLLVRRLSLVAGCILAIAYGSVCLYLFLQQTRMIFFPSPDIETTPAHFNLSYQEVWLPVAVGNRVERIHGWWIPAAGPEAGVLLYLHGNGVNIGANVSQATLFHQLGLSVLLIDYRGYGRSEGGFPTESKVYQDAEAAWNYLLQQRRVSPERIFLYGHSLGGAIAINLAVQHSNAAGLIVQSSFTSIRNMVSRTRHLGLFPIEVLLTQRFDSIHKVRSLQIPVLFIHGTADLKVPADMSETLYAATPEPKQLWLVPGAAHDDVANVAGPQYLRVVQRFIRQASKVGL